MNEVPVYLSEKERKVYDSFRKTMVAEVEGKELDALNASGLSVKLMQMANGSVYTEHREVLHIHDRKLDALEDLIEAQCGKPVLVAYWFNHDRDRIRQRFGYVREIKTARDIDDWNNGEIPIAIIHPAAVEDYRWAKKKLKKHPKNEEAKLMIKDCEAFFRSDRFTILSNLDGEDILKRLSEE